MIPNVETSTNNYIVDQIGDVVTLMAVPPFYIYGHRTEIASVIREMTKSEAESLKFPLIALNMDIPESSKSNVIQYSLNIAVVTKTLREYNAAQRMENTFKPILYPLYYEFMRGLKTCGLFFWDKGQKFPEHTKIDRPFWGVGYTGANGGNGPGSLKELTDDPIDAIEIVNLKINSLFKPC